MAGLLDGFGDFIKTPEGQGLLAATFGGLAGARSGAPINSIGRAGLAGMQGYSGAIDRQQQMAEAEQAKRARDVQMELYQAQAERAKAQAAKEQADAEQKARIAAGMGQFFKSGSPALAPLMGDESTGILPSKGRAAVAPSFDSAGAAAFLAQNGAYEDALKYLPKPKETPINKLDVKDFTPASVQKFAQSGDYADLVRMDKAQFQNTGGFTMALDPFTGKPLIQIQNTQSPDSKASTAVSWANHSLSKDRLNFDKAGGTEGVKPKLVGDQWVTAPSDMKAGEVRSAMPSVVTKDAKEALELIKTAKTIIPKSTGSYFGAGVDQAARVFGASTEGDTAAAQLKALEGALVSKMPKMSGPQSDKDVALYKQMAGEIGDATIPQSRKMAALQVIEEIQRRHSGTSPKAADMTTTNAPTMRWNPKTNTLDMVN